MLGPCASDGPQLVADLLDVVVEAQGEPSVLGVLDRQLPHRAFEMVVGRMQSRQAGHSCPRGIISAAGRNRRPQTARASSPRSGAPTRPRRHDASPGRRAQQPAPAGSFPSRLRSCSSGWLPRITRRVRPMGLGRGAPGRAATVHRDEDSGQLVFRGRVSTWRTCPTRCPASAPFPSTKASCATRCAPWAGCHRPPDRHGCFSGRLRDGRTIDLPVGLDHSLGSWVGFSACLNDLHPPFLVLVSGCGHGEGPDGRVGGAGSTGRSGPRGRGRSGRAGRVRSGRG